MKSNTSNRDWLFVRTGCKVSPPGPISGPIEAHQEPDEPLSGFRDEQRWSEEIVAWSKAHAHELAHELEPASVEE